MQSAANLARNADLAIVFAYQWEIEGMDLPNLSLPGKQDDLIEQVAAANPRTIVVLETGTAVTMPWIDKVAGVVEAWYAGSCRTQGARKRARWGCQSERQTRHDIPEERTGPSTSHDSAAACHRPRGRAQNPISPGSPALNYAVHYDEGAEVGYKWFEAEHKQPLFAFGFGLSYTTYSYSGLERKFRRKDGELYDQEHRYAGRHGDRGGLREAAERLG